MALNQLRLPDHGESLLSVVTRPTPVQKRAFQLLGVNPDRNVPIRLTGWPAAAWPKTHEYQQAGHGTLLQISLKFRPAEQVGNLPSAIISRSARSLRSYAILSPFRPPAESKARFAPNCIRESGNFAC
ncbi:MAG: hypothetical protein OXC26_09700 [Albidovulum sp.]|nr:hypothetical protein [Albidovulum sp.]